MECGEHSLAMMLGVTGSLDSLSFKDRLEVSSRDGGKDSTNIQRGMEYGRRVNIHVKNITIVSSPLDENWGDKFGIKIRKNFPVAGAL